MQRGTSRIHKDSTERYAGDDRGESPSSKETNPPKIVRAVNSHSNLSRNQGSRFNVLEDQMDMETKMDGATDEDGSGENQGRNQAVDDVGVEVVMETQKGINEEGDRVNVCVSHSGLAEGLRPLEKTKTEVRTQAHVNNEGPRKQSDKALRDVTNKLDPKPIIGKPTRILMRIVAGQKVKFGEGRSPMGHRIRAHTKNNRLQNTLKAGQSKEYHPTRPT